MPTLRGRGFSIPRNRGGGKPPQRRAGRISGRTPSAVRPDHMSEQTVIPMLDLKAQYAQIKTEVDDAVARVVASTHYINGPDVEALEQEIARYSQTRHGIGVS